MPEMPDISIIFKEVFFSSNKGEMKYRMIETFYLQCIAYELKLGIHSTTVSDDELVD